MTSLSIERAFVAPNDTEQRHTTLFIITITITITARNHGCKRATPTNELAPPRCTMHDFCNVPRAFFLIFVKQSTEYTKVQHLERVHFSCLPLQSVPPLPPNKQPLIITLVLVVFHPLTPLSVYSLVRLIARP